MTLSNYIYLCLWLTVYNENVPDFEKQQQQKQTPCTPKVQLVNRLTNEKANICFDSSAVLIPLWFSLYVRCLLSLLLSVRDSLIYSLFYSLSFRISHSLFHSLDHNTPFLSLPVFIFSTTLHHLTGYFMAITYYHCISDVTIVICSVPSALYCFLFIKPMVKSKQNSFTANGFDTNFWGTFKRILTWILL